MIVDCHCHVIPAEMTTAAVPERWRPRLGRDDDGTQFVALGPRVIRSIAGEFMDVDVMLAQAAAPGTGWPGVDHLLLSPWIALAPADPSAGGADVGEARHVCAVQNEAISARAAARPERVSGLGAVPIGDPEVAADVLRGLIKLPGMRGAEIPASAGGRYLGDDAFEPFWAAAEETGALIFVHPSTTGFGLEALRPHYLWNSVGNPLETAVTAAHLITAGVLERHPGLKILLAHGGGAIHAVRGRLRRAFAVRPEARSDSAAGPDASLLRLHYDALTHDPAQLADLVAFAGADRVLLGSDRPFDMGSDDPVADVRALGLPGDDEALILGGNAERLLGMTMPRPAGETP